MNVRGIWNNRSCLPPERVITVEQVRRAAVAGVFDEIAGEQLGIADTEVGMSAEVEIDQKVDFVADILAGEAASGPPYRVAGGVVQGILGLIQAEDVPLGVECDP